MRNLIQNKLNFFISNRFYKQLALRWQVSKPLLGLNLFSLGNNKKYRLKKSGVFLCNKRKIAVTPTMHQNSAVSKTFLGKF